MMLRYSFGLVKEADAIEEAVKKTLSDGIRIVDLMPKNPEEAKGMTKVSCSEMGDAIADRI